MPGVWKVRTVFNARDVHPGCARGIRQAPGPSIWGWESRMSTRSGGGNVLHRSWAVNRPGLFDESLEGHGNETEWMMRYRKAGRTHRLPARGSRLALSRENRPASHDQTSQSGTAMGATEGTFRAHHRAASLGLGSPGRDPSTPRTRRQERLLGGLTQAARALGYAREGRWQAVPR